MNLPRTSACIAVLVIHIALLTAAVHESRDHSFQSSVQNFVSTWVALPNDPTPSSRKLTSRKTLLAPINPNYIETPEIDPAPLPSENTGKAIDWAMEAQKSTIAFLEAPKTRDVSALSGADSSEKPQSSQVIPRADESYRDLDGNNVIRMNDNCYVFSEAHPLGTPDVFARMTPTRTVCIDRTMPEGELFKDLQAYKKYHPQ